MGNHLRRNERLRQRPIPTRSQAVGQSETGAGIGLASDNETVSCRASDEKGMVGSQIRIRLLPPENPADLICRLNVHTKQFLEDHGIAGGRRFTGVNPRLRQAEVNGWTRDGRFVVKRKTQSKRMTVKLKALRVQARRRMHAPVSDQHHWLCQLLRGHYAYYGLSSNIRCLKSYLEQVRRTWFRALRRRNQRRMTWGAFGQLLARFPLPTPRITHPCAP